MTMRDRWNRVDAEHWVQRLLETQTLLLTLWTVWSFFLTWAGGFVLLTVFPATIAVLSGWLTSAWRRGRPWAWWAAVVLAGMGVNAGVMGLLGGDVSWFTPPLLVFDGLSFLFLLHPHSRSRVERRQPPLPDRERSVVS
ncbi:MAG: hypothetical protein ABWY29_03105 [Blastococcus sp.]